MLFVNIRLHRCVVNILVSISNFILPFLVVFHFRMSRRVSTRLRRPSAVVLEDEQVQPPRRRRRIEQNNPSEGQLNMDELVEKVANAVLAKLQTTASQQVVSETPLGVNSNTIDNAGNRDETQSEAAVNVHGSIAVVSENFSNQAEVAANVQGSVAAVLGNLSGQNGLVNPHLGQPKDIFVSSDIPIDMSVPEKIKTKIWSNEYVDFGILLNKMTDQASYHLCLDTKSTSGQPLITLESNNKPKKINSIEVWTSAYQVFVGVYTQKYPSEAPGLMKYSEIVRELAARGCNWQYYDANFRYLRQNDHKSCSWGSVHWELWIRAQPATGHNANGQYKKNVYDMKPKSKETLVPKGFCWRYHKGMKCDGCKYSHSCPLCEKSHQMINCSFRVSKEKPHAANTSSSNTSKRK